MYRVISANTNGIRAAARKGFFDWLKTVDADVVAIQETKAQEQQLVDMKDPQFFPEGYHSYYHSAEKKGYSGVALYCKAKPDEVIKGIGWQDIDAEGRYIEAKFGDLSVISLYMHSGSASEERQQVKYGFMDRFMPLLREMRDSGRRYIIVGDWNIAHKKIDIKNWRGNQKNSGFLPEERAWFDQLFGEETYIDTFRELNDEEHQYTWWSNRGQSWANNTGWRIDYQVVTPNLKNTPIATSIYKEERFSDHAPLIVDYDFDKATK